MSLEQQQRASRAAKNRCEDTCPAVEKGLKDVITNVLGQYLAHDATALSEAVTALVEATSEICRESGTYLLRNALLEAELERVVAEDKVEELEQSLDQEKIDHRDTADELSESDSDLSAAQREISGLSSELDGALSRISDLESELDQANTENGG